MEYWLGVLQAQIPTVMEKATASEDHSKGTLFAACRVNPHLRCTHSTTNGRLRVFPVHHHSPEHCVAAAQCRGDRLREMGTGMRASVRSASRALTVVAHERLDRPDFAHRGAAAGGGVWARIHRAHRKAADVAARVRGAGPGRPVRDARGVPTGVRLRGRVQVRGHVAMIEPSVMLHTASEGAAPEPRAHV